MAPPARRRGSDGATWLRTFAERSIAWATVAAASYQGSLQGVVDTPSSPQLCVSPNAVRTSSPVASRIVIPSRSPYTGPTRARRLPSGRRHLARGQRCDGPAPSGVSALRGECEHHSRAGFAPDRRLGRSLGDLLPARPASVRRNLAGDVVSPDVCRLHGGSLVGAVRGRARWGTGDGLRRARSILLGHLALTIPSSRRRTTGSARSACGTNTGAIAQVHHRLGPSRGSRGNSAQDQISPGPDARLSAVTRPSPPGG